MMSDRHNRHDRTSFTRFLRNVLDDAQDFLDDSLDRAGDLEHDLRKALSNSLRSQKDCEPEEREHNRDRARPLKGELADLREAVDRLATRLERAEDTGDTESPARVSAARR
ncbi:hypothetical protein LKL35_35860 [Streptomyces sp. ET3-23]|uniref:hypothetical protein n=1 Tax=Streptomyces sp. ET3-23 TaxID=2885643 RepID=UPI001D12425A|nr:hypothetical protein [Streptomyces sp. ET3-23]MCC2280723.1 hypothetical protein [Streptomyces sp. ET3-23]